MNSREILYSLILFVVAILLWQLLKDESPPEVDIINPQEIVKGYYINGAELTRYNRDGQAEYTISADKIVQNLTNNNLELSNIQVNYHTQGNWQIKADNATLPSSRENIQFLGNVLATQENTKQAVSFESNSLNYNVANQNLSTQDTIKAIKGSQIITAKGMSLEMKNQRIKLRSRVKIRFLP